MFRHTLTHGENPAFAAALFALLGELVDQAVIRHDEVRAVREQQVLELVEQGYKNKEIAMHLGIQPGTVKIHLKHIFEKTGVRGRYGLALTGLRDRGGLSMTA